MDLKSIKDFDYFGKVVQKDKEYDIFTKKVKKGRTLPSFSTHIRQGEERLAYIYYDVDFANKTSHVIGLEVVPELRGRNFSDAVLETYFRIAERNNLVNYQTEVQRKPLTIFLLQKYGYIPINPLKEDWAKVLSPKNKKMRLKFDSKARENSFLESRLYAKGQYQLVGPDNQEPVLGEVCIGRKMILENWNLFYQRRKTKKNLFEIFF